MKLEQPQVSKKGNVFGSITVLNNLSVGGLITDGTWNGDVIGLPYGGSGQTSAQASIDALTQVSAATNEYVLTKDTATGNAAWKVNPVGVTDHGVLTGLSDDDHAGYVLLSGRSGGQILIGGTGTTDGVVFQTTSGVGASGADMRFLVGNNGGTEAATILNNGNIGFGVTDPDAKVEVGGQVKITGGSPGASKVLTSDANGLATWETPSAGGGDYADGGEAGGANRTLGNTDDYDLGFLTNNVTRIFIDNGGKVGVNNPAPAAQLDILGVQPASGGADYVLIAVAGQGATTTGFGDAGGGVALTSGQGGTVNGSGTIEIAGSGGVFSLNGGKGGESQATGLIGQGGLGGRAGFFGGAGGDVDGNASLLSLAGGGGLFTAVGGAGGNALNTTGTANSPGIGGTCQVVGGPGGITNTTNNNNAGGKGGPSIVTGGAGGKPTATSTGTNTSGNGGDVNLRGGRSDVPTGGAANVQGIGGNILIETGDGSVFGEVYVEIGQVIGTRVVTVSNNLRVGIGPTPTIPAELLELEDANGTTAFQISNTAGSGNCVIKLADSGTVVHSLGLDGGDSDKFKIGTTSITTNVRFTIDGDNIGINTENPSANADLTLQNGVLCFQETTTPTADANYGKIYAKADNKLYFQDGAGTEHEVAFV